MSTPPVLRTEFQQYMHSIFIQIKAMMFRFKLILQQKLPTSVPIAMPNPT